VETLTRLPEAFLCYAPPTIAPVSPLPPFKRKGHITFGSFNNVAKISQASVTLWSHILLRVPESKLLLKHLALRDPGLQQLLHDRFQAQGVTPDRVVVVQPTLGHREHLETYAEVDIALDTFPYHGTTTTTEALWMGVPVVTLQGDRHASRVGVSLLSVVGLPELIAQTSDEYVEIAAQLAAEPTKVEEFRRTLRSKVANSRLTDGPRFARDLEHAYREMWRKALDRSKAA
jgi:predicted O-linked N-acetylglucosamine transferase (SPINDLY family)